MSDPTDQVEPNTATSGGTLFDALLRKNPQWESLLKEIERNAQLTPQVADEPLFQSPRSYASLSTSGDWRLNAPHTTPQPPGWPSVLTSQSTSTTQPEVKWLQRNALPWQTDWRTWFNPLNPNLETEDPSWNYKGDTLLDILNTTSRASLPMAERSKQQRTKKGTVLLIAKKVLSQQLPSEFQAAAMSHIVKATTPSTGRQGLINGEEKAVLSGTHRAKSVTLDRWKTHSQRYERELLPKSFASQIGSHASVSRFNPQYLTTKSDASTNQNWVRHDEYGGKAQRHGGESEFKTANNEKAVSALRQSKVKRMQGSEVSSLISTDETKSRGMPVPYGTTNPLPPPVVAVRLKGSTVSSKDANNWNMERKAKKHKHK